MKSRCYNIVHVKVGISQKGHKNNPLESSGSTGVLWGGATVCLCCVVMDMNVIVEYGIDGVI